MGARLNDGGKANFYSRPCGRGDTYQDFLEVAEKSISTHAPAGGATSVLDVWNAAVRHFYSRPCGRGDASAARSVLLPFFHFYSRPCGRGDGNFPQVRHEVLRQIAER